MPGPNRYLKDGKLKYKTPMLRTGEGSRPLTKRERFNPSLPAEQELGIFSDESKARRKSKRQSSKRQSTTRAAKKRQSAGTPASTPTEFQSSILALKKKYAPDGRTKGEASLRRSMNQMEREQQLDDAAVASVPNATPAREARIRKNTSLTGNQKAIKELRGRKVVGKQPPAEVARAAEAGRLRRDREGDLTTPQVRQARRKVATVSRRLNKARKAASGGHVKSLQQAGLDPEQARILATVLKVGNRMGATEKEKLAATMTALVESNIGNPDVMTDHDSLGWRQERVSQYGRNNAMNVKGGAKRFFEESVSDTGGSRGAGMVAGDLAQTIQGSAFPDRYEERRSEATALLNAFNASRSNDPKAKRRVEQLTKVAEDIDKEAKKLGLPGVKGLDKEGTRAVAKVFIAKQRKGDYAGSQQMVTQMLGQKVWGDKETGHTAGGDHDPEIGDAYAQDIQLGTDNPSEGEPLYDQGLLDKVTRRIRKMGGDIPDLVMGMGMVETNVQGYRIQIIPDSESNFHGSGPHLHIGAKWTGENPPPGTQYGGTGGSSGWETTGIPMSGGGGSYTTGASPAAAAGQGPASRKGRKSDVLEKLREIGFNVTAGGVKKTGLAAGSASKTKPSAVLTELQKEYGR